MPDLPSPELKQLIDALDSAFENPPRDLPEGALEQAKEFGKTLRGYTGSTEDLSPGERERLEKSGATGEDTAVEHPKAARGPDQASPGQREFQQLQQKAQELAQQTATLTQGQ